MKCPSCDRELYFDPGDPGTWGGHPDNWEPPTPPEIFCENPECSWELDPDSEDYSNLVEQAEEEFYRKIEEDRQAFWDEPEK